MRDSSAAVWTFVIGALVCGVAYAVLVPPLSGPDEDSHFNRAWWVSKGHALALREGKQVGYVIPAQLHPLAERFRPKPTVDPAQIRESLSMRLDERNAAFIHDPNHAIASVVPYIPQGIGIAIGRVARASPVLCIYLGRLMNVLAGAILIAFAVRLVPSYQWLMALLALTPMANYLRGTLSGDVVTIAIAFLFTALVARAVFLADEPISARLWTAVVVTGALLCLTKVTYIPMAMLPLVVPWSRFRSKAVAWRARAIHVVVAFSAAVISSRIAAYYWEPFRPDVPEPRAQFDFIFSHPLFFARVLFDEFVIRAKWYLISMVGDLGSGNYIVILPKLVVAFFFVCLLALVVIDTNTRLRITAMQRLYFALLCAAGAGAIAIAIYTTWNLVGSPRIDGLQGRYFLPFAPAAAFVVHRAAAGIAQRYRMAIVIGATVIANAVAIYVMVRQWYSA